jgi:3-oxoacyl-[acyl-carrier protein] reductase
LAERLACDRLGHAELSGDLSLRRQRFARSDALGGGGLIADTAYAASKAGTLSLVKSVARELAGKKVRINALNPGPTDSPMHSHIDQALKDRIAANLPIRRMGRPEDMAAAILFLCSDAASFVYGSALDADGGSMFR